MLRSKLKCSKLETQACNYVGIQWLIQTGSGEKNKIRTESRVVMLTEIFKVIPFYFSNVYAFFFFFKISKALYSKAIPVSLFMRYPSR